MTKLTQLLNGKAELELASPRPSWSWDKTPVPQSRPLSKGSPL